MLAVRSWTSRRTPSDRSPPPWSLLPASSRESRGRSASNRRDLTRRDVTPVESTLLAVALDLQRVGHDGETPLLTDPVLQPLDLVVGEFDDLPALEADHVIVMMTAVHRLVAGLSFARDDLLDEPARHEMGQGPV